MRKALVVGINRYENFRELSYCVDDANEVAEILRMNEYNFDVTLLTDTNATRKKILAELQKLFLSDAETVIFYFAGHGATSEISTSLATPDGDYLEIGIDLDYLKKLVQRIGEEKTSILILDCCHSGAATIRDINAGAHYFRSATNNDFDKSLFALGSGKVVLAACDAANLAYENPTVKHGMFTNYLLEGLYGDAADSEGKITIPNIYDFISKKFEGAKDQKPVFKGDITGRLVIGEGLTPRERTEIPEDQVIRLNKQAQDLMNEYIQSVSTDIESWKTQGYKEACLMLSPRIRWFEKQIKKYPKLKNYAEFKSAYATVQNKLADLGHLMEDMSTKIGTVKTKIGSGTFGTVWEIYDENTKSVAYKVYHPTDLDNSDKISRFKRGYDAMEQLNHPHIVKVYQYTEAPIGFVMDYIEGPNLRDFAFTSPEPTELLIQLLTVADTLKHAHSRGVVHRDVKPENIIMHWEDGKHRPYLTDFDLAWFSTATKFTKEGLGSLIYAAPEQLAKPTAHISHEPTTDIYAFGQLLFYFISRRDPVILLSNNSRALAEEVRNWGLEEPARKIVSLYELCTQQEAKDRIQDFRYISDTLFEVIQLLDQPDHKKIIGFDSFTRQLIFSIIGLSPERKISDNSFFSPSKRVEIQIKARYDLTTADFTFTLNALESPMLDGVNSHKDLRILLNQKIDSSISNYKNANRRTGKQSPYEAFIDIKNIKLNIDSVEICRQILTRAIDSIEGK